MRTNADSHRMRIPMPSLLLACFTALAALGTAVFGVGKAIHSPGTISAGILLAIPLLAGGAAAVVAATVAMLQRIAYGKGWYSGVPSGLRTVRFYATWPKGKPATDLSPIALSEPPSEPTPLLIADAPSKGHFWRTQLPDLQGVEIYEGFRCKRIADDGFLLALPRTRLDWISHGIWVSHVCVDLVEDKQIAILVLDCNHLTEDRALRSALSLIQLLYSTTIEAKTKLRLTEVPAALTVSLEKLGLTINRWTVNQSATGR